MPRDTARSSASASSALLERLGDERTRAVGVVVEAALRRLEVHRQADEALLRTVVDVALHPAQRLRLGGHRGTPALGELGGADPQRGSLIDEQPAHEPRLRQREAAEHGTQGEQQHDPHRGVEGDVGETGRDVEREVKQGLVALAAGQRPLPEQVERLPEPADGPRHGDRKPHDAQREREDGVQQVAPGLRVEQRPGEAGEPGAAGGAVVMRGQRPPGDRIDPAALQTGEPAGGGLRPGQQRNPEPDDERSDAGREAGHRDCLQLQLRRRHVPLNARDSGGCR